MIFIKKKAHNIWYNLGNILLNTLEKEILWLCPVHYLETLERASNTSRGLSATYTYYPTALVLEPNLADVSANTGPTGLLPRLALVPIQQILLNEYELLV